MKQSPVCYIVILVFLFTGCKPLDIDPVLSSYVNTDPDVLSFTSQAGNKQIVKIDIKRGLHGTGPFGNQQRSLQASYSPSLASFKFYLEVDGNGDNQYLTFSPHDSQTESSGSGMIFLLPCGNGWECDRTKMHDKILINGKAFQDVIAVSVTDAFVGAFSTQDWNQGFDSLYVAKQQGLVGFTTNEGEAYSLDK